MKKTFYVFALFALLLNGCKKEDKKDTGGGDIELTGQLGGVTVSAQGTCFGLSVTESRWGASDENILAYGGSSWKSGGTMPTTYGFIKIYKSFLNQATELSQQQIYDMYQPGPRSYQVITAQPSDPESQGVAIAIRDENDVIWYSAEGDNTGSTFNITSRAALTNDPGCIVGGNFSCTVYDGNGNSKTFTGTFNANVAIF